MRLNKFFYLLCIGHSAVFCLSQIRSLINAVVVCSIVRLGTASLAAEAIGATLNVERLDLKKYGKDQALSKVLNRFNPLLVVDCSFLSAFMSFHRRVLTFYGMYIDFM